jgi:ZIP family zinc transporter
MNATTSSPKPDHARWLAAWSAHVRAHPVAGWGLLLGCAVLVVLWSSSLIRIAGGAHRDTLAYAMAGGAVGFLANALGALPALLLRHIPQRMEDVLLGFAAGMMLAASCFSLLLPGLDAAAEHVEGRALAAIVVVSGMALGVLLMLALDAFTPHEHDKTGPCGPGHQWCSRAWLFSLAIALHNVPEGMAIGVGFADGDFTVGLPITVAIALQDAPEGLAVALALRAAGFTALRAVLVSVATGAFEPLGALFGLGLSSSLAIAYPLGLSLAAGAMLFVVSHEVIPETHRHGHQTSATLGLMAGFALMMVLDTALG